MLHPFRAPLFILAAVPFGLPAQTSVSSPAVDPAAALAELPPLGERRDVRKIYAALCASCHGAGFQGAQAPSLIDDVWRFGSDDESIAKSIRDGHPESGMPPMGPALTAQEVRGLVIYLREEGEKFRRIGNPAPKPIDDLVVTSQLHAFRVETVVEGVEIPWALDFLPDGRMLVTERPGRLRILADGALSAPISGVPRVWAKGQGGMLDVAVHPDFARNGWIYLSYSDPGPDDAAMTAVVRGRIREGMWADEETIFRAPVELYRKGNVHFGCKLVFDGEGHLYFVIGERGHQLDAQDVTRPNGKVHRVREDGSIPADNPFVGSGDAMASIWSFGHRNPQGLALHPATGLLYDAEHGPRGGDELNLVYKARNYGWPIITYGMNYNGSPITDKTAQVGMEQPITHWVPSIAVSAIDFYAGDKFPAWRDQLFVGALAQQEVRRLEIDGHRVVHQEVLFRGVGRVREVVAGPDGFLYLALNEPDRIARLVPAD